MSTLVSGLEGASVMMTSVMSYLDRRSEFVLSVGRDRSHAALEVHRV